MESNSTIEARKWFLESVATYFILRSFVPNADVRHFIACQFALESGFGKSALAIHRHNFCGMKIPSKRLFFGHDDGRGDSFASYTNLNDCIKDYVSWLLYNRPTRGQISSVEAYADFLESKGYCPETDYVNKVRTIYNQFYC